MKIAHRITLSFVIAALAVLLLAIASKVNIDRINDSRGWVEHTLQVIVEKETLESTIKDLESRSRGFAATGDERFLDGTVELKQKVDRGFINLKRLTLDNPVQQENLEQLSPLLANRLQKLEKLVQVCRTGGPVAARPYLILPESGSTWKWMTVTAKIRNEEQQLLNTRAKQTLRSSEETQTMVLMIALASLVAIGGFGAYIIIGISRSIRGLVEGTERVAAGEVDFRIPITTKDEMATLGRAFNSMIERLRVLSERQDALHWHRLNLNNITALLEGHRNIESAGQVLLANLVPLVEGQHAALYVTFDNGKGRSLRMVAAYGLSDDDVIAANVKMGEGLIGECARSRNKMILRDVHPNDFIVKSALTSAKPLEVVLVPLIFENASIGVIELASRSSLSEKYQVFLDEISERVAVSINSITVSAQVDHLLMESQAVVEELQSQQEELESQQEELRSANEELEDKAEVLDRQNHEMTDKNIEMEQMQAKLEEKANELTLASKYKSEFLANMSHDLRTPLNSLLIFSELLAENDEKNLQECQVDYAKNIHAAGKTLLSLIDDILDLSKIESGTVILEPIDIDIADIVAEMQRNFEMIAESKNLQFVISIAEDVPQTMRADRKRLSQLLTNLLSNAFKFTEKGSVTLTVSRLAGTAIGGQISKDALQFQVADTGIGISKDMHQTVFEAFRQADGSIKLKYGGTGLGLAICRQLSELLGGHIDLQSASSEGSTFTVDLPLAYEGKRELRVNDVAALLTNPISVTRALERSLESSRDHKMIMQTEIEDDRRNLEDGDRVLLLIEDNPGFARMLLDTARELKFKGVVAMTGSEGLLLARKLQPDGITLSLKLPDMEGRVVLDRLKINAETKHIPVHIISIDKERQRGLEAGAVGFLEKPVSLSTLADAIGMIKSILAISEGKILLVEGEAPLCERLSELLSNTDVKVLSVPSGELALEIFEKEKGKFDCVLVDFDLKDIGGVKFVETIQDRPEPLKPSVLVYAHRPLSADDKALLAPFRKSGTVKDVDSREKLLSEAVLFLHRVEANLPERKRSVIISMRQNELPLVGRKVLIVDDDPRNIAALRGALQKQQMNLLFVENGKEAVDTLVETPDIELILMDIMMPIMDGYEAMQKIRTMEKFANLPMIAVTAKAMKEDRRKCLEAGASDYITKPVDRSQLLSLLRVWLYKR
jgi:signal transduction histidine kinase/DNA-binding response OmpR family regulator/CHASE3 domain sensor protein